MIPPITADSNTWPRRGSMWILESNRVNGVRIKPGTILMFVQLIYVTKNLITVQFLSADKVYTWTLPIEMWQTLVTPMMPPQ